MPLTIECEVSARELVLLRKVRDFMRDGVAGGRSPKAHEVVPLKRRFKNPADRQAIADFRRLVVLGAITHSRNGHCWLSAAGQALADWPGAADA